MAVRPCNESFLLAVKRPPGYHPVRQVDQHRMNKQLVTSWLLVILGGSSLYEPIYEPIHGQPDFAWVQTLGNGKKPEWQMINED